MAQEDAGIVLTKNAHWQPDHLLVIEAENTADYMLNLHVTFRGTGNEVSVCIGIFPHWPCTVPIPLSITDGKTLFPERTPGRFKATVKGANLRFEDLEEIEVSPSPCGGADVMFGKIAVEPAMPASFTMPREPLVDELHQWRARDWPGKAHTIEDVRAALENELAGHAPAYPDDWSHYGGWKEMTFRASGFFRTEHDGRRWWLVDPEGHAFWSIGVDCVRTETSANVAGIETVFSPPLPSAAHAPHLWSTRGNARLFSAMEHNLERALGSEWKRKWLELTKRRLRRYRVNTIANWSDRALHGCCGVPYVFTMASFPKTTPAIFRDFPDVYSEEYERNSNAFAGQLAAIRDDRNVIGYFMTNEPQWAFVGGFDIGAQLLMADAPFASLAVFIEDLKRKYATIDALNRVWGSTFASFDELRRKHDPRTFPGCKDDTTAFTRKAVERYVRVPAAACRAADPNHLNLGLRWAWIHSEYQLAGADVLDAFSINCYQLKPDPAQIASLVAKTGRPVMIGEFHIGCLDRGLPSGGIRNTRTMAGSVSAYRYYIENAAAIPGLIGAHYFQWNDQHVMGRFDGENMQIGLHDITCRPYGEWQAICRAVHPSLYHIANGDRQPFADEPACVPQGTLVW